MTIHAPSSRTVSAAGPPGQFGYSGVRRFTAGLLPDVRLLAVIGLLTAAYFRWAPLSPDLAAQVARADVVRAHGLSSWWTGWFGGVSLPGYSLLAPSSMALLGVRATAVLSVLVTVAASRVLARDCLRPRATVAAVAVAATADAVNGRVTFAAGIAVAALALVALRNRRIFLVVPLAAASYAASPLAALFLGIIAVAVTVTQPSRRRPAVLAAATVLLVAGIMALAFPGTGTMPFPARSAIPAALCCGLVAAVSKQAAVRVTALLTIGAGAVLLVVPGAIGENITRLAWVGAIPAVVAAAPLSRRALAAATLLLAAWPAVDLTGQLTAAAAPSSQASFYSPLSAELSRARASLGVAAIGQRLEVVDTNNHWASVYLADWSLARGWDRQADRSDNPLFYQAGALTASSYHSWLTSLAVGWVAVPTSTLDYASQDEATLVATRPGYLRPVWSNPHWTLYRVTDAAPLAVGAVVTAVHDTDVQFTVRTVGPVTFRFRYSPYLTVLDAGSQQPVTTACLQNLDGFVHLSGTPPGRYQLVSHFDPARTFAGTSADCAAPNALGR